MEHFIGRQQRSDLFHLKVFPHFEHFQASFEKVPAGPTKHHTIVTKAIYSRSIMSWNVQMGK